MPTDIFNQLVAQYTGSITNIQSGSIALGQELFNSIALISVAVLGINHLLKRNVDMVEANIELIKWLMYLICFFGFITNYPKIYPLIYTSIQQIGGYLGAKASGSAVDIDPGNIIGIGFSISKKILFVNLKYNLFRNFLMIFVSVAAAGVVLYCFAAIGVELILVQIGSQIIMAGGIFLLAFSGLQWTRDYAERYVHTFFHVGIKMIFIYILVGLGIGLSDKWTQVLDQAHLGQLIDYDIAVLISSFVFYKLCIKVPDQAASYLTGRLSMGFDSAASVTAGIKGAAKIPDAVMGVKAGIQGAIKAVSVAGQVARSNLQTQGKDINVKSVGIEAIKTLGAARKAEWEKVIDETKGGKLAKDILATLPKVKKVTTRKIKKDPTDDPNISTDNVQGDGI